MTGAEFQAAIAEMGLSRKQAAEWLGVGLRSVERWCAQGVSGPVELCIKLERQVRKGEGK